MWLTSFWRWASWLLVNRFTITRHRKLISKNKRIKEARHRHPVEQEDSKSSSDQIKGRPVIPRLSWVDPWIFQIRRLLRINLSQSSYLSFYLSKPFSARWQERRGSASWKIYKAQSTSMSPCAIQCSHSSFPPFHFPTLFILNFPPLSKWKMFWPVTRLTSNIRHNKRRRFCCSCYDGVVVVVAGTCRYTVFTTIPLLFLRRGRRGRRVRVQESLIRPLTLLAAPGMYLFQKINRYKQQQQERDKKKVTEKELQQLNMKIVSSSNRIT